MNFAGLVPVTLVDYPGVVAATLFTAGCALRCGFCQNPALVIGPATGRMLPEGEVLAYLKQRRHLLRGVCVTGGEPTLHGALADFLRAVRDLGYRVKLDTSGIRPDVVAALLDQGLCDYIAMDIKAVWSRYGEVWVADPTPLMQSVALIRDRASDYEFRTTVVPGLVEHGDVLGIARSLRGARRYVLQQFVPRAPLLDPAWQARTPHPDATLWRWSAEVQPYFQWPVQVRNARTGKGSNNTSA